jgi:adenosine deaminase CECR1
MRDQTSTEWLKGIRLGKMGGDMKGRRCMEWYVEWEKWCEWVVQEFGIDAS